MRPVSNLEQNIWISDNVLANQKSSEKEKGDPGSESTSHKDDATQCKINTTTKNCVSTRTGHDGFKQNKQATQDSHKPQNYDCDGKSYKKHIGVIPCCLACDMSL